LTGEQGAPREQGKA